MYTASRQAERLSSVEYDNICPLKRTVAHYASGGLFLTDVAGFVHKNEASYRHHYCHLPVSVVFDDISHSVCDVLTYADVRFHPDLCFKDCQPSLFNVLSSLDGS